jgi:hypothetical protein
MFSLLIGSYSQEMQLAQGYPESGFIGTAVLPDILHHVFGGKKSSFLRSDSPTRYGSRTCFFVSNVLV